MHSLAIERSGPVPAVAIVPNAPVFGVDCTQFVDGVYKMRKPRVLNTILLLFVFAVSALAQGATGTLTGKVVDAKGQGISGVRVVASGSTEFEGKTDAKGVFRLEVQPGQYQLQFEAEGYSNASLRDALNVAAGQETKLKRSVELPEADEETVVRGSTFNIDGLSVSGARVIVERIPDDSGAPVPSFRRETRTDSMGLFTVRVQKGEGRYRLTASHEKYKPSTVIVNVLGGELVNAPVLKLAPNSGSK